LDIDDLLLSGQLLPNAETPKKSTTKKAPKKLPKLAQCVIALDTVSRVTFPTAI